jgi:hypothetical protein
LGLPAGRFPFPQESRNAQRLPEVGTDSPWLLSNGRSNAVITSRQYRQRAKECLILAESSTEVFVRVALTELAREFEMAADAAEQACLDSDDNGIETDAPCPNRSGTADIVRSPQPAE